MRLFRVARKFNIFGDSERGVILIETVMALAILGVVAITFLSGVASKQTTVEPEVITEYRLYSEYVLVDKVKFIEVEKVVEVEVEVVREIDREPLGIPFPNEDTLVAWLEQADAWKVVRLKCGLGLVESKDCDCDDFALELVREAWADDYYMGCQFSRGHALVNVIVGNYIYYIEPTIYPYTYRKNVWKVD